MPYYKITAINIGSFNLGEADRLLTLFSSEKGLVRAVAKSARKPGMTMTGRSELLNVNRLLLATGRSLDIIVQAQSIETFSALRKDLVRLTYAFYYAELTSHFGTGLVDESASYFNLLKESISRQSQAKADPESLCLVFELGLLNMLGYKPELTLCVSCRKAINDHSIAKFDHELGGVTCRSCSSRPSIVAEQAWAMPGEYSYQPVTSLELTPLVWKQLVLASNQENVSTIATTKPVRQSLLAAQRLIQSYIEYKAGKGMKSLDLLKNLPQAMGKTPTHQLK